MAVNVVQKDGKKVLCEERSDELVETTPILLA